MKSLWFFVLCAPFALGYTKDAKEDQVKTLPGAEKLNIDFNYFSGYIKGSQPNHFSCVVFSPLT
jgi:hypothetical protein